jgi:hypothetical protein
LQRERTLKHLWLMTLVWLSASAQAEPIRLDIAAGKVGEVCMPLRAGDTLAWTFEASAAVDFNLHDHVGKTVNMPVRRSAVAQDRAQLKVPRENDWCLMWTAPRAQGVNITGTWQVIPATPR